MQELKLSVILCNPSLFLRVHKGRLSGNIFYLKNIEPAVVRDPSIKNHFHSLLFEPFFEN